MTVSDLLTQITRIVFVVLAFITLVEFVRYRDKVRRDVALVFASIATTIILSIFLDLAGIEDQGLRRVGSLVLLFQPFLLLRIVAYFRPANRYVQRVAVVGLILSAIILLAVINQDVLPAPVSLVFVIYFTLIDGYAIYAFIRGAMTSVGVVRNRLRLAAAGSALLVAVLLVAGIRTMLPNMAPFTIPVIQMLAVLASLAYFLSFATPRWLRHAWQLVELRDYLQFAQSAGGRSQAEVLSGLTASVARAMSTDCVAILLEDEAGGGLCVAAEFSAPTMLDLPVDGIVHRSLAQRQPQVLFRHHAAHSDDSRFMESLDAELLLAVPIVTQGRTFGVQVACLTSGSLFIDDDVQLLTLFVQQAAILLENDAIVGTMKRYTVDLERQVKQRTAALARSNQELRQFAYIASHDLKEPLRTISSYLQLIEQRYADKLDSDAREFIDFAVDGAARMKSLIDDLLIYSRVEREDSNMRMVDLQAVLDEALLLLEASVDEAEATFSHDPLPSIRADEHLMIQLFQNLISNALKYRGERKPVIHIGAKQLSGEWQFSVCDNGIGIEEIYLERIFVIFRRLHSQGEYSGTGIGLAVCKKAVEIHGGRIWAESEVGKGTTFFFTIPK